MTSLHLPKIAIVNRSTVLSDDQVKPIAAALQIQVSRDFGPAWALDCFVSPFGKGEPIPADWWQLVFADDSDQAGALGYHELTAPSGQSGGGQPVGFVFAKTDLKFGLQSSVTASHELLEMLADPWICATALYQTSAVGGAVYALEVCDPVEDEAFAYRIDGVPVSNFVLPAYFRDGARGPYDFGQAVKQPFALARGGYLSRFVQGQGWGQVQAQDVATPRQLARQDKGNLSRTERRNSRKGT